MLFCATHLLKEWVASRGKSNSFLCWESLRMTYPQFFAGYTFHAITVSLIVLLCYYYYYYLCKSVYLLSRIYMDSFKSISVPTGSSILHRDVRLYKFQNFSIKEINSSTTALEMGQSGLPSLLLAKLVNCYMTHFLLFYSNFNYFRHRDRYYLSKSFQHLRHSSTAVRSTFTSEATPSIATYQKQHLCSSLLRQTQCLGSSFRDTQSLHFPWLSGWRSPFASGFLRFLWCPSYVCGSFFNLDEILH